MAKKKITPETEPTTEPKAVTVSNRVEECVDKLADAINASDMSTFRKNAILRQVQMIKRSAK